ncbi:TadE/TadG family type IV pilus assembly protein [Chthonobacter rhizosphaerae]|uniref:TadE/TadG family type IV pilus assembly protein n=1 Tax=Chthonobacter rhizosphaerae TaxID=2735553 RepID=UPI0015EFAD15|nr:TadE/TadG family type IV pilus assembly protein [Chthonobacter rhizosphaerae]
MVTAVRAFLIRVAARAAALRADRRGVSAVEFALILPIMLVIYAGCVELSEALSIDRKVNRIAATIGDLFSQYSTMTATDVTNVLNASSAIIVPYASGNLKLMIYTVNISATGEQKVGCATSRNSPTGVPTKGSSVFPHPIPTGIAENNSQVIVAYSEYSYSSPFSTILKQYTGKDSYSLSHVYMIRPRLGTPVTWC